jgi:hypothetical protein
VGVTFEKADQVMCLDFVRNAVIRRLMEGI